MPGRPFMPPMRFIILKRPPPFIFFIIPCIWSNWLSRRLTSWICTPAPAALRRLRLALLLPSLSSAGWGRGLDVAPLLPLFDQGHDVAHAEHAASMAFGVEHLQAVDLFRNTGELDRHTGDLAHGQGRAAARIAIELGEHDAGQRQGVLEGLGGGGGWGAAAAMSAGFWSGVDGNHSAPAWAVTVLSCSRAAGR